MMVSGVPVTEDQTTYCSCGQTLGLYTCVDPPVYAFSALDCMQRQYGKPPYHDVRRLDGLLLQRGICSVRPSPP